MLHAHNGCTYKMSQINMLVDRFFVIKRHSRMLFEQMVSRIHFCYSFSGRTSAKVNFKMKYNKKKIFQNGTTSVNVGQPVNQTQQKNIKHMYAKPKITVRKKL